MYNPNVGRWNGVDALAEEYAAWSPYNYTLNNPILFVDPDGKKVKPGGNSSDAQVKENSLAALKSTLSAEDAAYVILDENGFIDEATIMSHTSESGNFQLLQAAVSNPEIGFFTIAKEYDDIYIEGQVLDYAKTETPMKYSANLVTQNGVVATEWEGAEVGITLPKESTVFGNFEMYVASKLDGTDLAEVSIHELVHFVFAVDGNSETDPKHNVWPGVPTRIWENGKPTKLIPVDVEMNTGLLEYQSARMDESAENYNKSNPRK